MPDDFVGVPKTEWLDLRDRVSILRGLIVVLAALFALLVLTLVQRGVLASPLDLFRLDVRPAE